MAAAKTPPLLPHGPPVTQVFLLTSSHGNHTVNRLGQHDITFIPYNATQQVTVQRIQKPGAQIQWVLEQIEQHREQLQKADIVIVLVGGNNYPSTGRPLPVDNDIVTPLVSIFNDLVTMGVRAVCICELLPRYPYKCTMDDAVAKEEVEHIEHVNGSLGAKLVNRCPKAKVSLFRTIWDRELEMHACTSCKAGFCAKSHHNAFLSRDHVHLTPAGYKWLRDRIIQTAYLAIQDLWNGVKQTVPEPVTHKKTQRGKKKENNLIRIKMFHAISINYLPPPSPDALPHHPKPHLIHCHPQPPATPSPHPPPTPPIAPALHTNPLHPTPHPHNNVLILHHELWYMW